MPVPFLLAGLGVGAALIGAGGHLSAKETNERAQEIYEEAQSLYKNAEYSLENAQIKTQKSLLGLGYSKKKVLETSISQFLISYDRIKNIEFSESIGLDEIKNFTLEKQDALQLREMADIYQSTFSSGATGAATGALLTLAASGSLPVVTGVLSTAGTALFAGEIGIAASLAGSALSFGAAMTPLAAIAAPALLFSGISSSMKADENLEKAETVNAEVELAVEQMQTSEVLCIAIADRADMFDNLLGELDGMFSKCTALLDGVTTKKTGFFKNKAVDAKKLSEDELKLVAVTRSLAGAVKAVIDTPILTSEGEVSVDFENVYENTTNKMPQFIDAVNDINNCNYNAKPILAITTETKKNQSPSKLLDATQNVLAIVIGWFVSGFVRGLIQDGFILSLVTFAVVTLIIMNNDTKSKPFKLVKNLCCIAIAGGFSIFYYKNCMGIVNMRYYIIFNIIIGVVSLAIFGTCMPEEGKRSNNLTRTLTKVFGCIFFLSIVILLFAFLYKYIRLSYIISISATVMLYAFFAFSSVFVED